MLRSDIGAIIHYKETLPLIDAIPLQINQLFYNLLTNALKFHQENKPPVIAISFRTLSPEETKTYADLREGFTCIEIKFSNNDIGFEQQFADQIFQLFERLHPVDEFEGTGVGLALCKKIVENHHGHILAIYQENEGASFHTLLPVKQ